MSNWINDEVMTFFNQNVKGQRQFNLAAHSIVLLRCQVEHVCAKHPRFRV